MDTKIIYRQFLHLMTFRLHGSNDVVDFLDSVMLIPTTL